MRDKEVLDFKKSIEFNKIKDFVLHLRTTRIKRFNPLEISSLLKINIKYVLQTCTLLEEELEIKKEVHYICQCGNIIMGDITMLRFPCNKCTNDINSSKITTLYRIIKE